MQEFWELLGKDIVSARQLHRMLSDGKSRTQGLLIQFHAYSASTAVKGAWYAVIENLATELSGNALIDVNTEKWRGHLAYALWGRPGRWGTPTGLTLYDRSA